MSNWSTVEVMLVKWIKRDFHHHSLQCWHNVVVVKLIVTKAPSNFSCGQIVFVGHHLSWWTFNKLFRFPWPACDCCSTGFVTDHWRVFFHKTWCCWGENKCERDKRKKEKKCLLGGPITKPMDLAITLCPFLLIFHRLTNMAEAGWANPITLPKPKLDCLPGSSFFFLSPHWKFSQADLKIWPSKRVSF